MSAETVSKSFSELIKGDTPVLVDFYADWCMPCKMMTPILQEVKSRMGDALQIIKIDAEKKSRRFHSVSGARNSHAHPV